jgi:hypothetical protein
MGCIDEYYGLDNGVSIHAKLKYFKNNPVELTLEQWDKIINKTMEENDKEIIGWKLKEDCKQYEQAAFCICTGYANDNGIHGNVESSYDIEKLKDAGVLELWFKPVYKQEFKVGDWVTVDKYITEDNLGRNNFKIGDTFCIEDIGESVIPFIDKWVYSKSNRCGEISINSLRKATTKEIKAAQTPQITINGYKGEFFDDYVKFGCANIHKNIFLDLNTLNSDLRNGDSIIGRKSNKEIESVTIGKGTFTKEQIKEIAEYYNER